MSLLLDQLIYTSFSKVGFKTLGSASVPKEIQQAFMQKVVYQYWNTYDPPGLGYRAAFICQVTQEQSLFGWVYNDGGQDDAGRSNVPYFVCYYLAEQLHAFQLNNIFTLLYRGPVFLADRQSLPASLDTLVIPDLWSYQPARMGVVIPLEVREQCHKLLQQEQLLELLVPVAESGVVNDGIGKQLESSQRVLKLNSLSESFMTQPSSQPKPSQISNDDHAAQAQTNELKIPNNRLPASKLLPTSQQAASELNWSQSHERDHINLTVGELEQTAKRRSQWTLRLKAKATAWALAVSMLPVLVIGTIYYFHSKSITEQTIQAQAANTPELVETKLALQTQLTFLLLGTGATAVLAGTIAAFLSNLALRPVLNAATISTAMVNRLRREVTGNRPADKNELAALETNIKLLAELLPDLLWKQEAEAERSQILMNITRCIRESLSQEDVLRTTVEEARKALRTDRVVIFRFDPNGEGTFVEESVAPHLPKMLWATIREPALTQEDIEQYQNGQVIAINDIYQASLTDSYIGFLERFAIKAYLVAPIIKGNQLFGLLITHYCSRSHFWQQSEINLFAQLATQVGFALEHARLVEQIDVKANQAEIFIDITRQIRESLCEEDILKTTVREIRKALRTERVLVYSFDADWYGTVVAESVLPGWPKALWANIKDPCFAEGYLDKYQNGRVHAIDNIDTAGLTDCYLNQLKPFAVKANLVAPILKDDKLFGLLIAHQCSGPRVWQQSEINLFAQLATQVGFALDHARLLTRVDTESVQTQLLSSITRQIRESLCEEDILKTTVREIRKALRTERVLVYSFDADWYGTVVAESVLPGWPKALWANIKDPCFAEGYLDKYQNGRVHAIDNIDTAGLTDCYLNQLKPFAVKANLVAPILKDDKLFGLLIAHQCSGPRVWQQSEINLFAQLATQVGFALDHAKLLAQVEQAYQIAEAASQEQRQQKEALQLQALELLRDNQAIIDTLSSETLSQMETITSAYNQIQAITKSTQTMAATAQQLELQIQQVGQTIQTGQKTMYETIESISSTQKSLVGTTKQVQHLQQSFQKLSEIVGFINNVVAQIKLQVMNVKLESARAGEAGQAFTTIAEKIESLLQQLDADSAKIKPLVVEIQMGTDTVAKAVGSGSEQIVTESELVRDIQQKLNQIVDISAQINQLLQALTMATATQVEASNAASQFILEAASITSRTSEKSLSVAESFSKLTATV